ncbi:MAG: hypothetical protein WDA71_08330 [Actinomycetota bacterium]
MKRKRLTTKIGIVVSVIMGLFPPWVHSLNMSQAKVTQSASYKLLFNPPVAKGSLWSVHIDFPRLFLQLAIVWGIVAAIHYFAKGKDSGNPPE